MNRFFVDLGKYWLEWRGRERAAPRYEFQENEVVSPGYLRKVSAFWQATYLNLHPTHYAIAVGPDGRFINLKGGYNRLARGYYTVYYVDRQNRVSRLPRVEEITSDGYKATVELNITYRLIDPIKALEVQQPVATLFGFLQSDLKKFIRSHKYHEFVETFDGYKINDDRLINFIKQEHTNRIAMAKLFFLMDVAVNEKICDPDANRQPEKYQIDQMQFDVQKSLQALNYGLEKRVHELEVEIQKMKTGTEVIPAKLVKRKNAKVFICYKKIIPDCEIASEIYNHLCELEYSPWMDVHDITPGQDWRSEIQKNILSSNFFIAILSNSSVSGNGFMYKELRDACDKLAEIPEDRIFIIPIKLDQCTIPDFLKSIHFLDWSLPNAKELLLRAIELKDN